MRRFTLFALALLLFTPTGHAAGWGYLYPDGSLPRAEWSLSELPPKPGAEVVRFDAEETPPGVFANDPNTPMTYDAARHLAVPWQAEIDRRAADAAATAQDRGRLAAQVTAALQALDALDADVAALAAMTDAQLASVAQLRAVIRPLGRDIGRLSQITRRLVRYAGRQAGAAVPAEQ